MAKWRDVKKNRESLKKDNNSTLEDNSSSASLGARFKAFLLDSFLITTPITYVVMYLILGGGEEFSQNRLLGWGLILGVSGFIITFLWYVKKQTPGMKAYDLKIVNDKDERISYIQALIRFFTTFFAICSFFLMFTAFFNKDKKTFQDLISRTLIIKE